MKIYYQCNLCSQKVYLDSAAKTRYQLANIWGNPFTIDCPHCKRQDQINVNSVKAEPTNNKVPIATTIGGGIVGILAGPLGILIGLAVGRASGGAISHNDKQDVKNFNNNYI